jgi:hypothetical protein
MYIVVLNNKFMLNFNWYYFRLILDLLAFMHIHEDFINKIKWQKLKLLGIKIFSNIKVLDSTSIQGLSKL